MNLRSALCATGLAAVAATPTAFAQTPAEAQLRCKGEQVAITFVIHEVATPLQPEDAAAWKDVAPSQAGKCRLASGKEVVLLHHNDPAYPWGAGGADPPAAMRLWIDGRVAASLVFKGGYGWPYNILTSVIVADGSLKQCGQQVELDGIMSRVTCATTPLDTAALPRDLDAPDYDDPRDGEISVISANRLKFCRTFIHTRKRMNSGGLLTFVDNGPGAHHVLGLAASDFEDVPFETIKSQGSLIHVGVAYLDVFGVGRMQTAILMEGSYKQFNGQLLMVHDGVATRAEIEDLFADGPGMPFGKDFQNKAGERGWRHLGGAPDAYVWNSLFRYNGELLVLATRESGNASAHSAPTAILYRPYAAGQAMLVEPICTFQTSSYF